MGLQKLITLDQFIIEKEKDFPYAKGELSSLLRNIGVAARVVNWEVRKAGLAGLIGAVGTENIQGEQQQKLDVFANEQFISALSVCGDVCVIASEENDECIPVINEQSKNAKYVVCIDPLDGSGNIDVNASIGTIFSIYRRVSLTGPGKLEDCLQKGVEQVAAGYVIYGSSTMLVYTTGSGVNGFTLDPSIGSFCLSHPNMRIPQDGTIYSINEGNYIKFPEGIKRYIKYCQENDPETNRPFSSRYIGSMVADLHRNILRGGVFIYPETAKTPNGKLRLLYECNPFAFIIEQAGGKATTGTRRIMEIEPTDLHQRTPIIVGSTKMVEKIESFIEQYNAH
jgi:fructose-1,6-bisphosphatase I